MSPSKTDGAPLGMIFALVDAVAPRLVLRR
jgi:hypothetical protein